MKQKQLNNGGHSMKPTLAQALSAKVTARENCNYDKTSANKLVLKSAFHLMNDNGYYSSVVDYLIVVTPSLQFGINVRIVGSFSTNPDAYGLKEQLIEIYDTVFREEAKDVI